MRVDFGGMLGWGRLKTKVMNLKRGKTMRENKESRLCKAGYQCEQKSFNSLFQAFRLWGRRSLTSRRTPLSESLVQANR